MSLLALLPLYRVEVSFLTNRGRRWSALEHLVLWACESPRDVAAIASGTGMPRRLVAECLLNLLRAGWVELRMRADDVVFSSTTSGRRAAAKDIPYRQVEPQQRSAELYFERLTGEFFGLKEDLRIVRRDGGPRPDVVLAPNVFGTNIQGPELVARLPIRSDESFDRLIRLPQTLPGDVFAAVEVDETGIHGLPKRTPASLLLAIRAGMAGVAHSGTQAADRLPPIGAALGSPLSERQAFRRFDFAPQDLVVGGTAHLSAAIDAISKARRVVVIHSTFIGGNLRSLLPAIASAAAAGVQVHLYWGKADDPEGRMPNPSEVAARMAVSSIAPDARRNIHLASQTTRSHAKAILADAGDEGGFVSLLGSCNWLDSPYESVEASLRLSDPALVATLAGTLAGILAPNQGTDAGVARLLSIQEECCFLPRRGGANRAMLVMDDDHYAGVRDAVNATPADGSILVGSHKFGHAAETTVFDPVREAARRGIHVQLFYSRVLKNLGQERAAARAADLDLAEVSLSPAATPMHAKFLAWSDALIVTSFNFLSASVNARARRGGELGWLVQGPGVAGVMSDALARHDIIAAEAAYPR